MKRRKEGLRNRLCPNKNSCLGYEWTVCDDCEIGNLISSQNTKIVNQRAKINHLKKENTLLRKLSNRLILTRGIRAKITKNHIEIAKKIEAENTALRLAVQYLINDGGADCCAKCIYCPHPTSEDDDCLCHHDGYCVDGVTKWFEQNG